MNGLELSVVIPVFNEKESLPELLDRCVAACERTRYTFEIILVDDGSEDGSRDILSKAADDCPEITAVLMTAILWTGVACPLTTTTPPFHCMESLQQPQASCWGIFCPRYGKTGPCGFPRTMRRPPVLEGGDRKTA